MQDLPGKPFNTSRKAAAAMMWAPAFNIIRSKANTADWQHLTTCMLQANPPCTVTGSRVTRQPYQAQRAQPGMHCKSHPETTLTGTVSEAGNTSKRTRQAT
jgi:hypothetical protein